MSRLVELPWIMMIRWDGFKEVAHYTAAVWMFIALNVSVTAKALERRESSKAYFGWYASLAVLMFVGGLIVWGIAAGLGSDHHVLVIEVWEIVVFAAFWVVQTIDNWHEEPAC